MKGQKIQGQFVPLPRDLLASDVWRCLSINGRRVLDFLMLEWLRHAGKGNGVLLAPRRQIEAFGIGARHVSAAIEECNHLGLVDIRRGIGRRPSAYALTWLPLSDGTEPSNRWQHRADAARELADKRKRLKTRPKLRVVTTKGKSL